ncbi:MAG: two-component regulator propeller domain-containing protein [Mucilaginibacter sp.]|uniref:two-component regulator propeller domain-containing protein n=1 Tax=Mucilaginibacter sp. TaxID=1882438 RepID=UPI003267A85B
MRYNPGLIILFLTLLFRESAKGQSVSNMGIENGLSNNTVTSIYKDQTGLMWFGTIDGLNRYDGYTFKVFRSIYEDESTLPDDAVTCINSDKNQNIWVGTQHGLGIQNSKTQKFSPLFFTDSLQHKQRLREFVYAITRDEAGTMYVGTRANGLLVTTNGTLARQIPLLQKNKKNSHSYSVTANAIGSGHQVWAAVFKIGLCKFNKESNTLTVVVQDLPPVIAMTTDPGGNIFIGTGKGLFVYQPQNGHLRKIDMGVFSNAKINGLLIDKAKILWVMTDGQGIFKMGVISDQAKIIAHLGFETLTSNATHSMYEDELSRLWVGTLRGGIDILNDKTKQFHTYRHDPVNANSLVNDFTFSFCEDKDQHVWIGTDGGGISVWDRKLNSFKNYTFKQSADQSFNENYVTSIIQDDEQNMWLSTYGPGVLRFNVKKQSFENIPFKGRDKINPVWKVYKDHHNEIWAVCGPSISSLYRFEPKQNEFVPAPFKINEVTLAIVDDGPDNFWLGTFDGNLIHASKRSGIDKTINLNTSIRTLYVSKKGTLWIGTYGRGLFAYDHLSGRFKNYAEANGLCNNKVLNIEEDDKGNLWMSTFNGLSKLTPSTGKIENFYGVDGLQSNQFYYNASAKLRSGELIFGGIKGFTIFNPDSIKQFHNFPQLILSDLRVANTSVDAGSEFFPGATNTYHIDRIVLPYDKAILSLDFVALEYSLPAKIQYAYFLKGRDKTWNNIGNQHTINYSRFNEGNYVLKIKSTNASGVWNPKELTILITVLPPWYRSWPAYLFYLSVILFLLYCYHYYQKKQTQLHYEVKLASELYEKKISFFTNISHELRTPLTLIINPIKELLHSNRDNVDLIDISAVYRNSRRLLSLVDQLLLFRSSENEISEIQPSVLNLIDVYYEVFLCFNNQVQSKHLTYQFKAPSDDIRVYADRDKLEIVLFNLLSNAIKYTPTNGAVALQIIDGADHIEILVTDNGPGIPEETGEKLFDKFYRLPKEKESTAQSGFGIGLFLAKRYVDAHLGELSFTSTLGEGSTFRIRLPKTSIPEQYTSENQLVQSSVGHNALLHELIAEPETDHSQNLKTDQYVGEILSDIENKKAVILLIDDDAEMRTYIKSLLRDVYVVHEAENAESGFETAVGFEPDIILCDVVMPGMSGVEFCLRVKESSSLNHIPVILLTGTSSPEIKLKGIECGADDYITKPFESALLLARIKSMLKGRDTLKDYFLNEVTLRNNNLKIPSEYSDFLAKCIAIIEKHLNDESFSLKTFTEEIGMSRSPLSRKIRSISGLSISEFIRYIRLRKAAELMIQTDMHIKEIAYLCGFQDVRYFREQFHKLFEMRPSDFIRKYRNAFIPTLKINLPITSQKIKN